MVHVAYDRRTGDAVPRKGARQTVNREHGDGCVRAGGSINWAAEERIGTLNLVDLGWSDRLASFITTSSSAASTHNGNNNHSNHSPNHGGNAKHTGERRKETQSIRRSPSVLGDAITASGSNRVGQGHVPHQNSKLTYLPQNSLSENSTTLSTLAWVIRQRAAAEIYGLGNRTNRNNIGANTNKRITLPTDWARPSPFLVMVIFPANQEV
ncbi:hypothetical protein C8J57DRAFT_1240593 [Mycena rebaudengoi]|nr:hypothetical protein C8J57DRAFT_1240593 [Mycena rebaudengoi]